MDSEAPDLEALARELAHERRNHAAELSRGGHIVPDLDHYLPDARAFVARCAEAAMAIDTSDIPEATEADFARMKLKMPGEPQ